MVVVENHPYNQHHQFYRKNLHIHHHHHHHHLQHQRSTTFLPMLCSGPSIKDVSLPIWRDRASSSSCDGSLSPKIGCMGQVKKKKRNNKIAGFPTVSSHRLSFTSKSSTTTTTSSSSNSSSPIVKYSKLKNLFYGKNFSTPTTTNNTTSAASPVAVTTISSCGARHQRMTLINSADRLKKERCSKSENLGCSISIEEMDPPLPVIKKVQKVEEGNLWKRRSGGGPELKSLQLQQIHHPRICLQPTSV